MVSNGGFDFCISMVVLPPQMSVPGCECGILELEGITGFDALFSLYFRSLFCCRQINVISCIWFGVEPMMI